MIKRILGILIIVLIYVGLFVLQVIGLANEKGISYGVSALYLLPVWFIAIVIVFIIMFAIYLIVEIS